MSSNNIGDNGMTALSVALEKNNSLTFDLAFNNVGDCVGEE